VPVKEDITPYVLEADCLPPREEVLAERYHYRPCPADNLLPALRVPYLHVFFEPGVHMDDFWTNRMPKKLRDRLAYLPVDRRDPQTEEPLSPPIIGWGVHIVEGPNWPAFFVLSWLAIGASFVLALAYCAVAGDVSGAFGMASYLVGVVTVGVTGATVGAWRL